MLRALTTMLAVSLFVAPVSWINRQEPADRVFVWDFVNGEGLQTQLTERIATEFEEALIQSRCYRVLERRRFEKLLAQITNEKAIADLNDISKGSQSEVKKITNAQIVVFGKVDDDVDSGQIKISVTFQHFDSSKEMASIRIPRGQRRTLTAERMR